MSDKNKQKRAKKQIRRNRVRAKVFGTELRPRLSVFRANQHIYGQIINDEIGKTLVSGSSLKVKAPGKKSDIAKEIGKDLAKKALEQGIKQVVFDRGGNAYHGRIKALAEGAREGGLVF